MRYMFCVVLGAALGGCAAVLPKPEVEPEVIEDPKPAALPALAAIRPRARPEEGPAPSAEPEPVPEPAAAPGGPLGVTVASLGNPAEPGLWLKTPLVSARQPGTLRLGGASVAVMLIPLEGPPTAGSRMSLEAFQALGAPLTDLPEVTVSAG
ncbi:MAG: hypothetical protein AAFY38_15760 [Pseudomonadota bacterium]